MFLSVSWQLCFIIRGIERTRGDRETTSKTLETGTKRKVQYTLNLIIKPTSCSSRQKIQNIAVGFNDLVQSHDQPCFQPQKQQLYTLSLQTVQYSPFLALFLNMKSNLSAAHQD